MNRTPALTREFAIPCDERRVGSQPPNPAMGQPSTVARVAPQKSPARASGEGRLRSGAILGTPGRRRATADQTRPAADRSAKKTSGEQSRGLAP